MSFEQLRIPGLVLAGVVVMTSGFWLTRAGRPYSIALTTVHKLAALVAIVVIAVMLYQANRVAPLSALELIVVGSAAASVVTAFASGGVVSASETAPLWTSWIHRTVPYLAVVLSAASGYFSLGRL
ncbi:MAG TPA: hypothetical protein VGK50_00285 [Coriobacteriia bacterium]|jgi:hypothetical protein